MNLVQQLLLTALVLSVVVPLGALYITEKRKHPGDPQKHASGRRKRVKRGLLANAALFALTLVGSTIFVFTSRASAAEAVVSSSGLAYIGAALSVGMGSIAAGIATGQAAAAALGALSENEEIMGKALIFVALAEGIAIYGLIIAFMILNNV